MKTIANAIFTLFAGNFVGGALMGLFILISLSLDGFKELPRWLLLPAAGAALIFVRGKTAAGICAITWVAAGFFASLGAGGLEHLYGHGNGKFDALAYDLAKAGAPWSLVVGTIATILSSERFLNFLSARSVNTSQETLNREADKRLAFLNQLDRMGLSQVKREAVMRTYLVDDECFALEQARALGGTAPHLT